MRVPRRPGEKWRLGLFRGSVTWPKRKVVVVATWRSALNV